MKWVALVLFAIAFPASLLMIGKGFNVSLPLQESAPTEESADQDGVSSTPSLERAEVDLRAASTATLRKIDEIDKKIESAREDLRKNETAKQAVIKDLIKIQAKINAIIKSESNL